MNFSEIVQQVADTGRVAFSVNFEIGAAFPRIFRSFDPRETTIPGFYGF